MAHRIAPFGLAPFCIALTLAAAPAGAMDERHHWDWGQHHTSLAGDPPRPLPKPPPNWHRWDEHAAPVRVATSPPP